MDRYKKVRAVGRPFQIIDRTQPPDPVGNENTHRRPSRPVIFKDLPPERRPVVADVQIAVGSEGNPPRIFQTAAERRNKICLALSRSRIIRTVRQAIARHVMRLVTIDQEIGAGRVGSNSEARPLHAAAVGRYKSVHKCPGHPVVAQNRAGPVIGDQHKRTGTVSVLQSLDYHAPPLSRRNPRTAGSAAKMALDHSCHEHDNSSRSIPIIYAGTKSKLKAVDCPAIPSSAKIASLMLLAWGSCMKIRLSCARAVPGLMVRLTCFPDGATSPTPEIRPGASVPAIAHPAPSWRAAIRADILTASTGAA